MFQWQWDEFLARIRDSEGARAVCPGPKVHGSDRPPVNLECVFVPHVYVAGNDQVEGFLMNGPLRMRADGCSCTLIRDRLVLARVPSARVACGPADSGQEASRQSTACIFDGRRAKKPAKKAVAPVGRIQQISVFYPDPQIPQIKKARSDVHPKAQPILPEIPEIQVVVALEIVNLHSAGNDSAEVVHDGRKFSDEVFVAAKPEIEDVAYEEQVGRLDPGPHVLEKPEQDLGIRLIEVLQVDV